MMDAVAPAGWTVTYEPVRVTVPRDPADYPYDAMGDFGP
jgi:hypothetical protein